MPTESTAIGRTRSNINGHQVGATASTDDEGNGGKTPLPWAVILSCLAISIVIVIAYGLINKEPKYILVLLLIAAAAMTVGGLLGFMFGIPRTGNGQSGDAGSSGSVNGKSESPKPSTSLEQVSDWLTKILVGAGLVELTSIGPALAKFGQTVHPSTTDATGAIMAEACAVVFSILGFGAAYLWTRTDYARIQAQADKAIDSLFEDRLREVENDLNEAKDTAKAAKQNAEDTSRAAEEAKSTADQARDLAELNQSILKGDIKVSPSLDAAASVQTPDGLFAEFPTEVQKAVADFRAFDSADWMSDPSDTLFKGATATQNGRKLTARRVKDYPNALQIELRVERLEGSAPLSEPVAFLLHPTFRDGRIDVVRPRNDVATSTILSEEWFTVAAIVDKGQTVLKLSLKDMPDLPDWFTTSETP